MLSSLIRAAPALALLGGLAGAQLARAEPVFSDLAGERIAVSARKGEVLLLNFWSTWCAPCRSEMPVFVKLHEDFAPRGLRVLGVSADGLDQVKKVKAAMKSMDMEFEVWLWANANDMAHYGVGPQLPATLIIDREGKILHRFRGVVRDEQLRPLLEPLLE
jgi:thiol-disulfide isomerase/thioredoxin